MRLSHNDLFVTGSSETEKPSSIGDNDTEEDKHSGKRLTFICAEKMCCPILLVHLQNISTQLTLYLSVKQMYLLFCGYLLP